ncbi:hypothetical protein GGR53DRAFT_528987 [Hypoxylon sp. FL1150]|nr:hypothetical protein GGR53DRAFT_528987 [Hypoxylon sp. FL1150]
MTSNSNPSAFEDALAQFQSELKKKDRDRFKNTTMKDLVDEVGKMQKEHLSQARGQNIARIKPYIEAIEQFGKVVEIFANTSSFVAFAWIAGTFAAAFDELLGTYEKLGESIPLLLQYENHFREDPNMLRVLIIMYKDILEFHRQALRYFQQPMWKQIFHATWKTYKTRFGPLIDNIREHGVLVQNQATLTQIENYRKSAETQNLKLQSILDEQETRRTREVYTWLNAPNVENDQHHYSKVQGEYPDSGQWLLKVPAFKEWFDPKCPTILPPLLWMTGIPGAGKTILASLAVEEARKLGNSISTLFFYCRNGDIDRNSFASIGRSFLSQLLQGNKDILLPYYHDYYSKSTTTTLETYCVIESLLEVVLLNCQSVYIIIDGIDECPRDERKKIAEWFRNLVENNMQSTHQDRVRCLFVSQHDGFASKDFRSLTRLKVDAKDNEDDIKAYSVGEAVKFQSLFSVSNETRDRIATKIQSVANGMFLLAKLILINLGQQTSVDAIEAELEGDKLPTDLNEAYSRILSRLLDQSSGEARKASKTILRWLVCAKRTLKWHEIQAARSIHIESQSVDIKRYGFSVDLKDLCGSLVEIRDDGRVEFMHATAKKFMASEHSIVDISRGDIRLASLAIDYLNMTGFRREAGDIRPLILNGYYGFMDYAVPYWVRHLEEGVDSAKEGVEDLTESVETFLELHYSSPSKAFPTSQGNSKRLRLFESCSFHADLQQAVASARKELTFYGEIRPTEVALDLTDIVKNIRTALEKVYVDAAQTATAKNMEEMYGQNVFKCPRLSCRYFHGGFQTAEQRDQHIDKHDRPYRCIISGCLINTIGFATEKELQKHIKENHELSSNDDLDYPDDEEIVRSRKPEPEITEDHVNPELREERPEPVQRAPKRARISEFPCSHYQKVFKKKYNLESHLTTHSDHRPHSCNECDASFARLHDLNRHKKTHQEKEFICGGELENGQRWGCQKRFARADTLQNHYKTISGQACIPPET